MYRFCRCKSLDMAMAHADCLNGWINREPFADAKCAFCGHRYELERRSIAFLATLMQVYIWIGSAMCASSSISGIFHCAFYLCGVEPAGRPAAELASWLLVILVCIAEEVVSYRADERLTPRAFAVFAAEMLICASGGAAFHRYCTLPFSGEAIGVVACLAVRVRSTASKGSLVYYAAGRVKVPHTKDA